MPGPDGKMNGAEKGRFIAWLNDKTKLEPSCPVCGTNKWNVGDHLLNAMVFHGGAAMVVGGPTYPLAFVACSNCQYTRTFMAVPIGILDAPEAPKSEGGKDG